MHSHSLYETIYTETAPASNEDNTANVDHLVNHYPHLQSAWLEVLGVTNAASAARKVTAPTTIRTKLPKPGHKVLSPLRQLHFDAEVFPDPETFDADLFYRNKSLERYPSYKPFGGGVTLCPGKNIAK
jgi:cholesterol 7alpha-monooxygenase